MLPGELAPYAAMPDKTRGRVHPETEHAYRSAYQRDRDRIIHCSAFRRLQYKTQVFVNHEGDHYRTRLTHTLEVSQIGRTLARTLGLNEDLTEAICLAHDLGHTPFGHSGEDALNGLMIDKGGFEHNAQGLRVVDHLEVRYAEFPGLNLTYEVRESFAKHKTRHDLPGSNHAFSDAEQATLEAQIVVAADEIAYDNHDLDDGLASGFIHDEDVSDLKIWQVACKKVASANNQPRAHRAQMIRTLIDMMASDLIATTKKAIEKAGVASAKDVRAYPTPLISFSPELAAMKSELESFLFDKLYRHYAVQRMANKARAFLAEMFHAYVADPRMLPPDYQAHIPDWGVDRVVCDYIAGMTDRYAQQEYQVLFQPFDRT